VHCHHTQQCLSGDVKMSSWQESPSLPGTVSTWLSDAGAHVPRPGLTDGQWQGQHET